MRAGRNAVERGRIARIELDGAYGVRAARVLRAFVAPRPRRADAADEIEAGIEFFRQRDGDLAGADVRRSCARSCMLTWRHAMGSCAPFPSVRHASCTSPSPTSPTRFRTIASRSSSPKGSTIAPERPAALDALIAQREAAARATLGRHGAVADPRHRGVARGLQGLRHQADALSLLGRAAGEERARGPAARARERLRRSLQCGVACACAAARRRRSRPASRRRSPSAMRARATASSTWRRSGDEPEAPKAGEVVYADAAHVLCRRWNWRQDARSLITAATARAVVTVQGERRRRCRGRRRAILLI